MSTETVPSKRRVLPTETLENPVHFFGIKDGVICLPAKFEAVNLIRKGIEFDVAKNVADHLGIEVIDILTLIGLTGRTSYRRQKENLLRPEESDRLYRLMKVVALAEHVLEVPKKAKIWMMKPNRAVGDITPFSLMDTTAGADAVEDVLLQIEFGVYC